MARNLEVLVKTNRHIYCMAQVVLAVDTISPTVYHFARTIMRLHCKGMRVNRRYIKGVAKVYATLITTNAGTVANLLGNVACNRLKGVAKGNVFFTTMARNDLGTVRALRVGHATGTFVAVATAQAQLATLVATNAARIAALGANLAVHATAATFYRATVKLAKSKGGNYARWDRWHYAVTVNGFALQDHLVDMAIAHLARMPHWSAVCRTVRAKFNLGSLHPVLLTSDEFPG